jgi:bacillolysin/thermolysin
MMAAITAAIMTSMFLAMTFVVATANDFSPSDQAAAELSSLAPIAASSGVSTVTLRTPDSGQETASGASLDDGQTALIRWDADTGVPTFITGSLTPPVSGSPGTEAVAFLSANKQIFRMTDPASELVLKRQEGDALGMTHLQMSQVYKGVPVFGSGLGIHFTSDNKIQTINGHYMPGIAISVDPDITVAQAVVTAQTDFKAAAESSQYESPQLVVLASGGTQAQLAWKVTLTNEDPPVRMVYFIDAHSGGIASSYDALEAAKNRRTYTANNGSSTPGTLLITEGGSSGDSVAQAAHNNTGLTYDYYYNTFGRDSFNNAGATLTTTVHYGSSYNNAYWDGQQMVYGDGDGNVFSPLGGGLDVVAHELTHAVTQYTADLVYSYQSGALNESYSDVFGAMVDRDDWLMGEDVYTPHTSGDALRSLSNPALYGQPENMSNYVNTSGDNGGVHTNSGIPNKAAYNIALTIGKDKMERIWYRTLTLYLNSGSQFTDARDASVQAAADLYGSSSPEVTAVQNGFAAVGIGAGQTSNQTARVEIEHTYRGDLVVTLGVGNPDSPLWSTIVSNRQGGSAHNIYTTVDISGAGAYLAPSWQNRWYLKVYDAASQDSGQITKFAITDNGTAFTATDTPVAVSDFSTSYSYIPTVDNIPPTVKSANPANGSNHFNPSANVTATFTKEMNAANITTASYTLKRHSDLAAVTGVVSYDAGTKTATFNPNTDLDQGAVYDAQVTTTVTDSSGNHMVENYSWSFTVDNPPVLNPIGNQTVYEGILLQFTATRTDPDSGDTPTYSATNLPAGATLNPSTGVFTWVPGYTQAGTYPGVINTVTDSGGLTDSKTITITVNEPILIGSNDLGGVFLIENGQRRGIASAAVLDNWGFSWGNVSWAPRSVVNSYPQGDNLTLLAEHAGGVYLVQNNTFRPIFDANTFNIFKDNWNLGWGDIKPVSDSVFASKSQGELITFPSLVTYSNGGTVYYMDADGKRPIQNGFTFDQWHFNWGNIFYTRNNAFLASYPSPNPLSLLVSNNGGVYLIENGFKRPIAGAQSFNNHATFDYRYRWNNIFPVSSWTMDEIPLGDIIY